MSATCDECGISLDAGPICRDCIELKKEADKIIESAMRSFSKKTPEIKVHPDQEPNDIPIGCAGTIGTPEQHKYRACKDCDCQFCPENCKAFIEEHKAIVAFVERCKQYSGGVRCWQPHKQKDHTASHSSQGAEVIWNVKSYCNCVGIVILKRTTNGATCSTCNQEIDPEKLNRFASGGI